VLVGILLPALGKAREAANKTKCLSNLRQLGLAMQMYAMANHEQISLGCRGNQVQEAYAIWNGTGQPRYQALGLYYETGFIKNPTSYYCPADTDYYNAYDSSLNPWQPGVANAFVRAGYYIRPVQADLDSVWNTETANPKTMAAAQLYFWRTTTAGYPVIDQNNKNIAPFPKLTKFPNKAMLADIFSSPERIAVRHKSGINVYFSNGSAKWLPLDRNAPKDSPGAWWLEIKDLPTNVGGFSTNYNQNMVRAWRLLDHNAG
jgi:hypothetical protein